MEPYNTRMNNKRFGITLYYAQRCFRSSRRREVYTVTKLGSIQNPHNK